MKASTVELIEELIEKCENLSFSSKLNLSPQIHIEGLTAGLSNIKKSLEYILENEDARNE